VGSNLLLSCMEGADTWQQPHRTLHHCLWL